MQKRPINLKFFVNEGVKNVEPCAHKNCQSQGLYKAPKNYALDEHMWLCLKHVREHNAAWNYGGKKSYEEVDHMRQEALSWERESKPMHSNNFTYDHVDDPYDLFAQDPSYKPFAQTACHDTREALNVLGFQNPVNVHSLKNRYRDLVKEHHPDKNKGCKNSEERFKQINAAYKFLNQKFSNAA